MGGRRRIGVHGLVDGDETDSVEKWDKDKES
jgi:hypothetical protein